MRLLVFLILISTSSFAKDLKVAPDWQLELIHKNSLSVVCKASLLSKEWAITAAHCTSELDTEQPMRSSDILLKDKFNNIYAVLSGEVNNYHQYNSSNFYGDFSLLKLRLIQKGKKEVTKFPKIGEYKKELTPHTTKWVPNDKLGIYHYSFPVKILSKTAKDFTVQSSYALCQVNAYGKHMGSNSGSALYTTLKNGQDILFGVHSWSGNCLSGGWYFFTNLKSFLPSIEYLMEKNS